MNSGRLTDEYFRLFFAELHDRGYVLGGQALELRGGKLISREHSQWYGHVLGQCLFRDQQQVFEDERDRGGG